MIGTMASPPTGFPKWCVWWRTLDTTETTLGSVPVVLAVPTLSALVGTAWAVSHPADVIHHGLVVHQASFGAALASAVIGGALTLVAIVAAIFTWHLARYGLRGDPVWAVGWALRRDESRRPGIVSDSSNVQLLCVGQPRVKVSALGDLAAVVRLPSGRHCGMPSHGLGGDDYWRWFDLPLGAELPPGTYEARWYGTTGRRRRYEIARDRHTLVETARGVGPAPG